MELDMAKSVRVPMRHGSSRLCGGVRQRMRVLVQSSNSDDDDLPSTKLRTRLDQCLGMNEPIMVSC